MNHLKTLSTATLISLSAGFAQAVPVTIYSEDFAGDGTTSLIGTTEDTAGATWVGSSAIWGTDGTVNAVSATDTRGFAGLAVSLSNDTQYIAEATINYVTGSAFFFGFSEFADTTTRFHNQGSVQGWAYMSLDNGGGITAYEGPRALGDEITGITYIGTTVDLKIVVTTSSTSDWSAEYFVNGTSEGSLDLSGGGSDQLNYLGFSTVLLPGSDLSSLTFSEVPEPGSLALLGLGGLMMARRRRDN